MCVKNKYCRCLAFYELFIDVKLLPCSFCDLKKKGKTDNNKLI